MGNIRSIAEAKGPQAPFQGEMQKPKKMTIKNPSANIGFDIQVSQKANAITMKGPDGSVSVDLGRSKITAWPLTVTVGVVDSGSKATTVPVTIMYTDGQIVTKTLRLPRKVAFESTKKVPTPVVAPPAPSGKEAKAAGPVRAPESFRDLTQEAGMLKARYQALNNTIQYARLGDSKGELLKMKQQAFSQYAALDIERGVLIQDFAKAGKALPWELNEKEWFFSSGRAQAMTWIDSVRRTKINLPWDADYPYGITQ